MDLAGYVINAVLVEWRSVREVAVAHGLSKSWLYELLSRYRADGERRKQWGCVSKAAWERCSVPPASRAHSAKVSVACLR